MGQDRLDHRIAEGVAVRPQPGGRHRDAAPGPQVAQRRDFPGPVERLPLPGRADHRRLERQQPGPAMQEGPRLAAAAEERPQHGGDVDAARVERRVELVAGAVRPVVRERLPQPRPVPAAGAQAGPVVPGAVDAALGQRVVHAPALARPVVGRLGVSGAPEEHPQVARRPRFEIGHQEFAPIDKDGKGRWFLCRRTATRQNAGRKAEAQRHYPFDRERVLRHVNSSATRARRRGPSGQFTSNSASRPVRFPAPGNRAVHGHDRAGRRTERGAVPGVSSPLVQRGPSRPRRRRGMTELACWPATASSGCRRCRCSTLASLRTPSSLPLADPLAPVRARSDASGKTAGGVPHDGGRHAAVVLDGSAGQGSRGDEVLAVERDDDLLVRRGPVGSRPDPTLGIGSG